MLLKVDYFFTYRYVLRFLLLQKYIYFNNTFTLPVLRSLLVFFSVADVPKLDDPRSFNYFYLFRFFFGKRCFFIKFSSVIGFNSVSYSFNIQMFLRNKSCFFPLFFLINDLLFLSSKNYWKFFFISRLNGCFFFLRFFDLNLFLQKKTNAGLYFLYDNLNYKFFFQYSDFLACQILVNSLKFPIW